MSSNQSQRTERAPRPILEVAAELGLQADRVLPFGGSKAKIDVAGLPPRPGAKLILVTSMTPTPAGEGKTTTVIGLADGLRQIGKSTVVCLREPSLGPNFGMKGGATGGGRAQLTPAEDINLHFNGDFHAITSAHNLLAALLDNHIHWGNELGIDVNRIGWRRVLDVNDRALRHIVTGPSGVGNDSPRQTGFDITAASEVMAILCLADGLADLRRRLGAIVVGQTKDRSPVTAEALEAAGAMAALLKDALLPNLVQTLEGTPAIVHGGPFANIAHGCNSLAATRAGLALADYVVTEAGFGADLGAEKFFDIKCRKGGLKPAAAVVVATVRALKMHGGVELANLDVENVAAVRAGFANLARHIRSVGLFGVPVVVAINGFHSDTAAERDTVAACCAELGVEAVPATHFRDGGAGTTLLAERVVALAGSGRARFAPLYSDDLPLWSKLETICRSIYGADGVTATDAVRAEFARLEDAGYGKFPVCIAKTQYSFTADPRLRGAPEGFTIPVREVRLASGAGFVVVLAGDIMTMPGLPRRPNAVRIGLDASGKIAGLS